MSNVPKEEEEEEEKQEQTNHCTNNDDDDDSSSAATHDSRYVYSADDDDDDSGIHVGDHVYQWRSFAGIPGMVQHHGIVIARRNQRSSSSSGIRIHIEGSCTTPTPSEHDEQHMDDEWTIVDFSVMLMDQEQEAEATEQIRKDMTHDVSTLEFHTENRPSLWRSNNQFCIKTLVRKHPRSRTLVEQHQPRSHWRKVRYDAPLWQRYLHRSGTCTAVVSDPLGLVLARVQFLLHSHHSVLPQYHFLKANSECVAVWCKTNTWATLQASSFLELTAAGQVKSAGTLAMAAGSTQVTVPAAGFWGWLGFTTKVSLLATQPWIVPALAGYGLLSIGGPVWMLSRCKTVWNETTNRLQDEFWEYALQQPDDFAQDMTDWSDI